MNQMNNLTNTTTNDTALPLSIDIADIPSSLSRRNAKDIEITVDNDFKYDGYQVVRGEFFSHIYEPSITFNKSKIAVNTACVRKLPDVEYVQVLVNPEEKKLAIRPCQENEKDSFRWRTANTKKIAPKQITCRIFFAKIFSLMNWNPAHRYKLLGKLIQSGDELLFIFDLNTPEIYQRTLKDGEKEKTSRTPTFPEEWKDHFGLPVEEHKRSLQINMFEGYAVFGIQEQKRKPSVNTDVEELNDRH